MSEKIIKTLYGGEINIEFFPDSHRYKMQGQKNYLVSVTAATGIIDKSRVLIMWALGLTGNHLRRYFEESKHTEYTAEELLPIIDEALKQHEIKKQAAADTGSLVHAFAESFARYKLGQGEQPVIDENWEENVGNGVMAFLDWFNENKVEFIETEKFLYSKKYDYVGTTDVVAKVNDEIVIIDYKTSKGIYSEQYYQLAAYWGAYEEETKLQLNRGAILHFDKETGKPTFKIIEREELQKDFETFLACLTVKKREKEKAKY